MWSSAIIWMVAVVDVVANSSHCEENCQMIVCSDRLGRKILNKSWVFGTVSVFAVEYWVTNVLKVARYIHHMWSWSISFVLDLRLFQRGCDIINAIHGKWMQMVHFFLTPTVGTCSRHCRLYVATRLMGDDQVLCKPVPLAANANRIWSVRVTWGANQPSKTAQPGIDGEIAAVLAPIPWAIFSQDLFDSWFSLMLSRFLLLQIPDHEIFQPAFLLDHLEPNRQARLKHVLSIPCSYQLASLIYPILHAKKLYSKREAQFQYRQKKSNKSNT